MRYIRLGVAAALALAGCNDATRDARLASAPEASAPIAATFDAARLDRVLAAQPDNIKARYGARHPAETLEFFGLAPGMTVVDVLPGSEGNGWYTAILAGYLGDGGRLIGVDYPLDMWPRFGGFADAEFIAAKQTWAEDWVAGAEAREAAGEFGEVDVDFDATTFGELDAFAGQADAVLFLRALHNLSRFEADGGYLTQAAREAYRVLKPGGVVGVVQHRAPADADDEWALGRNGYVKQARIVEAFEAAGFELEAESEINANPADQPTTDDGVWRLPPTLGSSRDDPELKAQMEAIGESDRMTLRFRKPS